MQGRSINTGFLLRYLLVCLSLLLVSCFHETNHTPTANAGASVSASINTTITLDASLSSDVDGDSLSYQWEITRQPENSSVQLSDSRAIKPQLFLDKVGEYVVKLVVSDGSESSNADFITITTFNDRPTAEIVETSVKNGSYYVIGDTISVNASQSTDPENETLFYNWEISVKPSGSVAVLSNSVGVNPSFVVDLPGHYIVHLVVSDGTNLSEPKMMIFEIEQPLRKTDTRPVAEAGPDQALYSANTLIRLDGSRSYDAENDSLSYRWEMILKPEASNAVLSNTNILAPQFTADFMGNYVIKLIVSDMNGDSHLDTVIITPHENPGLACGDCHNNAISTGKPATHLLTYDDCFQCHAIEAWKPSKGVMHFHSHNAQPANCMICHNGVDAKGKKENHIVTDRDCNSCHQLSNGTWVPALSTPRIIEFSHKGIYSGCTACHDNGFQKGKPAGHMPTSDRCFACHATDNWASTLHLEHTQVLGQCDRCHDGVKARGKSLGHVSTTALCSQCHKKTTWSDL